MSNSLSKRKQPKPNLELVLYDEVSGICPKCTKPLMKKNNGQMTKLYEIAHIYPNSPRPHEAELLINEERLNQDVDHEDNLIVLCRDCHKTFDNPRTVAGYREMVVIKKELQRITSLKNGWFENTIEEEINEIIHALESYSGEATEDLSLNAMTIDEKSDSTLNALVKLKIKNYVKYFYSEIKFKFSELDKKRPLTSDIIYSQVKTYYIKLKRKGLNQTQIFSALTEWIEKTSKCRNKEAAETLVSFFIQNCEVYS